MLKSSNRKRDHKFYSRNSFNEFGDAVAHWKLKSFEFEAHSFIESDLNYEAIEFLQIAKSTIYKNNGHLFIAFPAYQKSSSTRLIKQIDVIEKNLNDNFYLLGDSRRYIFDDSLFFNSPYHLNKNGVDLRTARLIEDIKKIKLSMSTSFHE